MKTIYDSPNSCKAISRGVFSFFYTHKGNRRKISVMKISQLAKFSEYCHLNFRSLISVFTNDCCSLFGSFSSTYIPWKICPKLPSWSTSSPWTELSSPWIFRYPLLGYFDILHLSSGLQKSGTSQNTPLPTHKVG